MTAKERVLKKFPKAYARYVGLSLKFVVVNDSREEISRYRLRERDAWADAARLIAARKDGKGEGK